MSTLPLHLRNLLTAFGAVILFALVGCQGASPTESNSDPLSGRPDSDSSRPYARKPPPDDIPYCGRGEPNCHGGPTCCRAGDPNDVDAARPDERAPIVCLRCAPQDFPVCACGEPNCDNGGQCCHVGGPDGPVVCTSCAPTCGDNPAANSCHSDQDCPADAACLPSDRCIPSACRCDAATGGYSCTDDCAPQCQRRPRPHTCGGFAGEVCQDATEVCQYPAGQCDTADLQGQCVTRPDACTEQYQPVCGCDGRTYSNDCFALAAGAQIDHRGACGDRCEPVACDLACEKGFARNADGCEICACAR